MVRRYFIAFSLCCAASCYHAALNPQGSDVVLLNVRVPQNCSVIGEVIGDSRSSLAFGDTLNDFAVNDLRNKAAALGATHLVMGEIQPTAHASMATGTAYKCPPDHELK